MSTEPSSPETIGQPESTVQSGPVAMSGFFPPDLIVKQLSAIRTTQPVAALASANQHRAALTDVFLQAVERGVANPREDFAKEGMLFNYATYFLAKWRETRVYSLFLRWLALPGEDALELGGDTVTQDGARFLASVCGGQVDPIRALVQNREANEYCRGQALTALGVLVAWNEWPKEELENYLLSLARENLERTTNQVWKDLAVVAINLECRSLLPELRRACQEGLIPSSVLKAEDLDELERLPQGTLVSQFAARYRPIEDVAAETRWWAGFAGSAGPGSFAAPSIKPSYVAPPKVGRNDLCPCGSGKKFKKCCGH